MNHPRINLVLYLVDFTTAIFSLNAKTNDYWNNFLNFNYFEGVRETEWIYAVTHRPQKLYVFPKSNDKLWPVTEGVCGIDSMNLNHTLTATDNAFLTLFIHTTHGQVSGVENVTDLYDDYDYLEALNTYYWEELIPPLVIYSVTFILGIIGNCLIIFTISRYRRMKSTTNVFLASLASADLLLIIICIPVKLAKLFSYGWTLGFFMCKLLHYMQSVSAVCSVLTLTAMSVERYYAIVHPMKAKYLCTISQAKKIILAIWVAAFLLATPMLAVQILEMVGEKHPAYWCHRDRENALLWRLHELYMLMLILVVPTAVMAVTYTSICWEVWSVMQARYDMTTGKATLTCENFPLSCKRSVSSNFKHTSKAGQEENNTVKQVVKMLVMIVVVFVICWAPMLIDNCLTAWEVLASERPGSILKHMYTIFTLMAYFNSCVNPIVYGFMSKNFRESFQKALCLCWRKPPRRQLSMSQTRTTSLRYGDRSSAILANHGAQP